MLTTLVSMFALALAVAEPISNQEPKYVNGTEVVSLLAIYNSQDIGKPVEGVNPISYVYVPAESDPTQFEDLLSGSGVSLVEEYDRPVGKKVCVSHHLVEDNSTRIVEELKWKICVKL